MQYTATFLEHQRAWQFPGGGVGGDCGVDGGMGMGGDGLGGGREYVSVWKTILATWMSTTMGGGGDGDGGGEM